MKILITIHKVVELAKISRPTVYRKVRTGDFPKPKKVPRTASRGPKKVSGWEEEEVIKWAIANGKGNVSIKDAIELLVHDEPVLPKEDLDNTDKNVSSFYEKHRFVINAAVGGALSALLLALFRG